MKSSSSSLLRDSLEIRIPGSFVVLQGIPGDGLRNTIDTLPDLVLSGVNSSSRNNNDEPKGDEEHHQQQLHHDEVDGACADEEGSKPRNLAEQRQHDTAGEEDATQHQHHTTNNSPSLVVPRLPLGTSSLARTPLPLPGTGITAAGSSTEIPHNSISQSASNDDNSFVVVSDETDEDPTITRDEFEANGVDEQAGRRQNQQKENYPLSGSLLSQERLIQTIDDWTKQCQSDEQLHRTEWKDSLTHRTSTVCLGAADYHHPFRITCPNTGQLLVLDELPTPKQTTKSSATRISSSQKSLAPGTALVATGLVTLHTETLEAIIVRPRGRPTDNQSTTATDTAADTTTTATAGMYPPGRRNWVQFVHIESPCVGFVCLSMHGYSYLAPGLPSQYVDIPLGSLWRVTCPVGAFVREGLDLSTAHLATVPYGSIVRVNQKVVNAMGLSRLQVEAIVYEDSSSSSITGNSSIINVKEPHRVYGWCSEFLNPLSGQRGTIISPLPFPVPAVYRVTLPEGAVLRNDVELSSPQIGSAPCGTKLTVIGRALTEHPADSCIERLRLAGNGGWISVRLNKPPPDNSPVAVLEGIAGNQFDVNDPGSFHIESLLRVQNEQAYGSTTASNNRLSSSPDRSGHDLSSVDESSTSSDGNRPTSIYSRSACEIEARASDAAHKSGNRDDLKCLVCLTEERTATLVHGETGHIACCLVCARILKARHDPCPVCRLDIDCVIQHFWA